jgi:hypothetical protein
MLFFRWVKPGIAPFLSQHLSAQARTLGHFFEVHVIDYDCDYGELCDRFEPAITVFESGVYSGSRRITNTAARADIPKLGFLHSDAYDISRAVFLSDMSHWGVEDYFTTSVAMAEYTPEIAGNLFVWPNAIDPTIFRDYGLEKNIPVLITGSQERHYPWRNAVSRLLSQNYATMTMPHFGWGGATARTVFGESYAKLLNASVFVPTCGSMAKEVVRKQLEIPASMSCLVTERTPGLEAFGFEDMVNCVFAHPGNVLEKLDALSSDAGQLQSIVRAGYELVHSRHTEANRSQVLEWLQLNESRKPGQQIVQESPCGPLTLSQKHSSLPIMVGPGTDRTYIAAGWRLLRGGLPERAEREFLRCLNFYFIPEAITGLVFSSLARGDGEAGLDWATQAVVDSLDERGAADPDPVLWACLLRALICSGETAKAASSSRRFPDLRHPELDRVYTVLAALRPGSTVMPMRREELRVRPTIAPVPALGLDLWLEEFAGMLLACGQQGSAEILRASYMPAHTGSKEGRRPPQEATLLRRIPKQVVRAVKMRLKSGRVQRARMMLSPYKQRIVSDEWTRTLKDIARREQLTHAVLIGTPDARELAALEAGLRLNPLLPPVHRAPSCAEAITEGLLASSKGERVLTLIRPEQSGTGPQTASDIAGLSNCSLVVINGTTTANGYRMLAGLMSAGNFGLEFHEPLRKGGRAILRRLSHADVAVQSIVAG